MALESRNDRRVKRHHRARKNIFGTPERPRLCVFRSNKNISAQIIDDVNGTAETRMLLRQWEKRLEREHSRRESQKSASTEPVSFITEELQL